LLQDTSLMHITNSRRSKGDFAAALADDKGFSDLPLDFGFVVVFNVEAGLLEETEALIEECFDETEALIEELIPSWRRPFEQRTKAWTDLAEPELFASLEELAEEAIIEAAIEELKVDDAGMVLLRRDSMSIIVLGFRLRRSLEQEQSYGAAIILCIGDQRAHGLTSGEKAFQSVGDCNVSSKRLRVVDILKSNA
ncbi:hypothetical protein KCU78_g10, partial [Aureobasidium melanogenum]